VIDGYDQAGVGLFLEQAVLWMVLLVMATCLAPLIYRF
jgi:hypothetical protein